MKNTKSTIFPIFVFCFVVALAIEALAQEVAKPTAEEKLAQYEKAVPIILKQRSEADAMVRDLQLQLAMLAAENETLKKQLAEAHAKVADLTKPKDAATKTAATESHKTTAPKS